MKKLLFPFLAIATIVAVGCSGGEEAPKADGAAPPTTAATDANATGFAAVAQIASANCMPCHNEKSRAGGLALTSYADVMKGGEDGAVVKAGDPDNSLLVKVLHGATENPKVPQMPMKKPALAADQIAKIADWIKAGAKEA